MRRWTQADAVVLCRRIEEVAPAHGFHVALTGGCLYKDGERKDCDLLFYKVRQLPEDALDFDGLITSLRAIGFAFDWTKQEQVWCVRSAYEGKRVDLFFPHAEEGDYESDHPPSKIIDDLSMVRDAQPDGDPNEDVNF